MTDAYIVIDADESQVQTLDPMQFQAEWEQRPTTTQKGILRVSSAQRTFVEDTLKQKNVVHHSYTDVDQARKESQNTGGMSSSSGE